MPDPVSILYRTPDKAPRPAGPAASAPPPYFADLALDQVVAAAVRGREEYELAPLFLDGLSDRDAVLFRQEVARELEDRDLAAEVRAFAEGMRRTREHLERARKLRNAFQRRRAHLDAALAYCQAADRLVAGLARREPTSRALRAVRERLSAYVASRPFHTLRSDADRTARALEDVTYLLALRGNRVDVMPFRDEPDFGREIADTFAKFRDGEATTYSVASHDTPFLNHVEEAILDRVARLYPQPFALLEEFCQNHAIFVDEDLARFEREAQFYLAYLELIAPLREAGLPFCYPTLSSEDKRELVRDAFDLALAIAASGREPSIVLNGYELQDGERVMVVTGPNHGGKTTFARAFGQLHHVARLGLPVPAREARLLLTDAIFTHFPRQEATADLRGRLEDELARLREILDRAGPQSVVVLNETFSSTSLEDGVRLGRRTLTDLLATDCLAVFVTFMDELAAFDPRVVSMVAEVSPRDPSLRTFRIVRRPADGVAHALAIARKFGLTYDELKERVRQ